MSTVSIPSDRVTAARPGDRIVCIRQTEGSQAGEVLELVSLIRVSDGVEHWRAWVCGNPPAPETAFVLVPKRE